MLKIGSVMAGSALKIPKGPKFAPLIVAPPAPAKPEIVTCGYSNALATPICAFADTSCCSARRMSGRRVSSSDGKPGGSVGAAICWLERAPALDRARILSEQGADEVLGLLDLALDLGDGLRRRVEQRLGLPQVEYPGHAAVQPGLHEVAGLHRARPRCAWRFPA